MKIGDLVKWNMIDSFRGTIGVIVSISPDGRLYRVLWAEDGKQEWIPDWHVVEATDETR